MQNVKQRRGYVNQTWWINHVDCRHGEKIGKNTFTLFIIDIKEEVQTRKKNWLKIS